ncbi:substrate-binding domain-containing protein [Candidatus Aerophobetes bacterium]|nr:substrate-binding domain-containing protein [Candidatus Aerophobetes bacterium]
MRKIKNSLVIMMVSLLVVVWLTPAIAKKPLLGFILPTLQEERWAIDRDGFIEEAHRLGAEVLFQASNNDERLQTTQVENMLTQGIDILVLGAVNSSAAAVFVDKAHDEGIPFIAYTRPILNAEVDYFVWHDLYDVGRLIAEYTLKAKPKGNWVLIEGDPGDDATAFMREAFFKVVQPAIDRGDIKIVIDQHALKWSTENALKIAENALTRYNNNIQAICCWNDGTARGAIRALQEQGMDAEDCYTTGQDGDIANLQYIVEGKQGMTVYKPCFPLGAAAARAAYAVVTGGKPETKGVLWNGRVNVPLITVENIPVDKNNIVEALIKPGYVSVDEVYRNIPRDQWPKID